MSIKSQIKNKRRKIAKDEKIFLKNIDEEIDEEKETIELVKNATIVASSLGLSLDEFDNMNIEYLLKIKNK